MMNRKNPYTDVPRQTRKLLKDAAKQQWEQSKKCLVLYAAKQKESDMLRRAQITGASDPAVKKACRAERKRERAEDRRLMKYAKQMFRVEKKTSAALCKLQFGVALGGREERALDKNGPYRLDRWLSIRLLGEQISLAAQKAYAEEQAKGELADPERLAALASRYEVGKLATINTEELGMALLAGQDMSEHYRMELPEEIAGAPKPVRDKISPEKLHREAKERAPYKEGAASVKEKEKKGKEPGDRELL